MKTAKKPAEPKKLGRPSSFTPALGRLICERLSKGEPLAVICRDENMPAVRTVSDWKLVDADFSAAFARAREDGYDALAAQCLEIANTPEVGEETITKADGGVEVRHGDMLGHRKLQIETRLRLLARWDPKRYGEKMTVAGDPEAPLSQGATPEVISALAEMTPEQLRALASKPIRGE
jgi:hypothetical protein